MSIYTDIESALSTLSLPMAASAFRAAGGTLPDLFLVYTLVAATPEQHADNGETARRHLVQVSVYNRSGLGNLPDVIGAMQAAGFVFSRATELPFDEQTGFYGLALDFVLTVEV